MEVTFYVLTNTTVQTTDTANKDTSLLAFVCNLVQTIRSKTEQTLLIIDDDSARLQQLDTLLWHVSPTSFIPHDLFSDSREDAHSINTETLTHSKASILLTEEVTTAYAHDFDGVVLNLAEQPIHIARIPTDSEENNTVNTENTKSKKSDTTHSALVFTRLDRLLEIIPADTIEKEKGRKKYTYYKQNGDTLTVHKINN